MPDRQYPTVSKERVMRLLEFASCEGYQTDYHKKRLRLSTEDPHYHSYISARIVIAAKKIERLTWEGKTFADLREEFVKQLEYVATEAFWLGRGDDDFGLQEDRATLDKFLERLLKQEVQKKEEGPEGPPGES